jgi:hypothetical protein
VVETPFVSGRPPDERTPDRPRELRLGRDPDPEDLHYSAQDEWARIEGRWRSRCGRRHRLCTAAARRHRVRRAARGRQRGDARRGVRRDRSVKAVSRSLRAALG